MKKLIKLSDTHYIIVDDSEIKENQWYCNNKTLFLSDSKFDEGNNPNQRKNNKLVTHSTQPELLGKGWMKSIKPLLLSEVEEAVYGYSVEKMAAELAYKRRIKYQSEYEDGVCFGLEEGYIEGFKAHQELVKDKLFTIEQMNQAINLAYVSGGAGDNYEECKRFIDEQLDLLPKTEWDIEIDEQGKIKLI